MYLVWETAYGADYTIDVSNDAQAWSTVYSVTGNALHFNEIMFDKPASGRYIRMNGTKRGNTGADFGFSLYEFQVTATVPVPLPVSLIRFNAVRQGPEVAVSWATATELHNAGFEVQRSADGVTFSTLASVAGAGTTQAGRSYTYLDAAPLRATAYYRLKQVDLDGTATFGPVVAVQAAGTLATVHAYPNPATDRATLEWDASARPTRWFLTSSAGQVVHQEAFQPEASLSFLSLDLQPYPAGSYVLTLETTGQPVLHTRVQKAN